MLEARATNLKSKRNFIKYGDTFLANVSKHFPKFLEKMYMRKHQELVIKLLRNIQVQLMLMNSHWFIYYQALKHLADLYTSKYFYDLFFTIQPQFHKNLKSIKKLFFMSE